MSLVNSIKEYLAGTRVELKKVTWPSRETVIKYSISVVVFSAIVAVILGLFDFLMLLLVSKFLVK